MTELDREERVKRAKILANSMGLDDEWFESFCGKIFRQCRYCKKNHLEEGVGWVCRRLGPCEYEPTEDGKPLF